MSLLVLKGVCFILCCVCSGRGGGGGGGLVAFSFVRVVCVFALFLVVRACRGFALAAGARCVGCALGWLSCRSRAVGQRDRPPPPPPFPTFTLCWLPWPPPSNVCPPPPPLKTSHTHTHTHTHTHSLSLSLSRHRLPIHLSTACATSARSPTCPPCRPSAPSPTGTRSPCRAVVVPGDPNPGGRAGVLAPGGYAEAR